MNLSIGLGIALALAVMFGGYEHYSFKEYRMKVEAEGKQAEVKVKEVKKEQELATKGIENEYVAKINAIRANYERVRDTGGGSMPTFPGTTVSVDDRTANIVFIEQCTETTQQLKSLQEWINLQETIK